MRTLLVAGLILSLTAVAFAGGNPSASAYIDFDPPNRVATYNPAAYETFDAYFCIGNINPIAEGGGFTGASFMLVDPVVACPGSFAPPSFTNLLPGDLAIGNVYTGITLTSTECLEGPDISVGKLTLFYLGGECCIQILDHPDYPRWVTDCDDPAQIDFFCISWHGSIGGATCPTGDLDCPVPVNASTWGGIKALYR